MTRRLLALLALVAFLVGAGAAPASALPNPITGITGDCKSAPTPDMPGTGVPGWFEAKPPAGVSTSTIGYDPAAPMFEQFGFAGMGWNTYDLGCGPDAARDPSAVGGTAMANWLFVVPQFALAATSAIDRVAFHPTWLGVFDPLLTRLVTTLRVDVFARWIAVPILLVGLSVLWSSRKGGASHAASVAGSALFVMVIASALFSYPLQASHGAQSLETSGVAAVSNVAGSKTNDPSLTMEDAVYADVLYPMWLTGEVGSSTSPTAVKYGPALLHATAFTWSEARLCATVGAGYCSALATLKQDAYKKIAGEIQASDPAAYAHLTGHQSKDRVGMGMMATLAMAVIVPFLLMCGLLVLGAFAIIDIAIMLCPAVALVAVKAPKIGHAALATVGAAMVNAVVFAVGAVVMIDIVGTTLAPGLGLPTWLGLVLSGLFGFVGWKVLKPFRKLTAMVTGHNLVAEASGALPGAGHKAWSGVKGAVRTGAAAYVGGRVAGHTAAEDIQEAEAARETRTETDTVSAPSGHPTAPYAVAASVAVPSARVDRDSAPQDRTAPPTVAPTPAGPPPIERQPAGYLPAVADDPAEAPDLPTPVVPAPDGTYEVYRPGEGPDAPLAPITDDGAYQVWRPDGDG